MMMVELGQEGYVVIEWKGDVVGVTVTDQI